MYIYTTAVKHTALSRIIDTICVLILNIINGPYIYGQSGSGLISAWYAITYFAKNSYENAS